MAFFQITNSTFNSYGFSEASYVNVIPTVIPAQQTTVSQKINMSVALELYNSFDHVTVIDGMNIFYHIIQVMKRVETPVAMGTDMVLGTEVPLDKSSIGTVITDDSITESDIDLFIDICLTQLPKVFYSSEVFFVFKNFRNSSWNKKIENALGNARFTECNCKYNFVRCSSKFSSDEERTKNDVDDRGAIMLGTYMYLLGKSVKFVSNDRYLDVFDRWLSPTNMEFTLSNGKTRKIDMHMFYNMAGLDFTDTSMFVQFIDHKRSTAQYNELTEDLIF